MSYNTRILSLEQALREYAAPWQQLIEAEAIEPTQMPGWTEAICKAFEVEHLVDVWCAFSETNELLSIIPFQRKQSTVYGIPVKTIEPVTNLICYHCIFPGISKHPELFSLFLQAIEDWDLFIAPCLVVEEPSYQKLTWQLTKDRYFTQELTTISSPYVPITTDWDDYLKSQSRSFRYRLQRKAKAVTKSGDVTLHWYTDEFDNIDQLLQEILQIEATSWKVEAGMAISHRPVEKRYYERLLPFMATNGLLMANVLYIDNIPAAYGLCYNFKGRWGQLKTSFDDQFKTCSPGKHLVDLTIEQAFMKGASEFDFLGDRMRHKLEWTDLVRHHNTLYTYNKNTFKGKLTGSIKRMVSLIRSKDRQSASN